MDPIEPTSQHSNHSLGIHPIAFSGKHDDWVMWKFSFSQLANSVGLSDMLTDVGVTFPSSALVKLFNALFHSVPHDWRQKFIMLPAEKLKASEGPKNGDRKTEVHYLDTPHPAACFALLKRHFEQSNSVTKGALWKQLFSLKMNDTTPFHDFKHSLDVVASKLEAVKETVTDAFKVRILFEGVTGEADHTVANLEEKGDIPYDQACHSLQTYYSRAEAKRKYGCTSAPNQVAFAAVRHDSADSPCSFCNRSGHTDDKCWKKHPNLRPQGFRTVQTKLPASAPSSGQLKCRNCKKLGHGQKECPRNLQKSHRPDAPKSDSRSGSAPAAPAAARGSTARRPTESNPYHDRDFPEESHLTEIDALVASKHCDPTMSATKQFILDNGATSHFCNDVSMFYELRDLDHPIRVIGVGSNFISMIGCIVLPLSLSGRTVYQRFKHVYYAPFLRVSLLSIGVMDGNGVEFTISNSKLTGVKGGNTIITASKQHELFVVDVVSIPSFNACACIDAAFHTDRESPFQPVYLCNTESSANSQMEQHLPQPPSDAMSPQSIDS